MFVGKKYLILAALVLALGAAVYLNWQFTPVEEYIDASSDGENSEYVVNLMGSSSSDAVSNEDEPAVTADKKTSEFDKAKNERDATRQEALNTLKSIIDDASLSDSQKKAAVESYAEIAEWMDKEADVELLIKAKGFNNCVVVISDNRVNVLVPASSSGLSSAEVAMIMDIVMGQLEISSSNVTVVEVK